MRLLILGGTRFVGRHLVEAALSRGHAVTLFNRGLSAPGLFPDTEELAGDRERDLSMLKGRNWDAVIDTCGYLPRVVRASAEALAPVVDRYVFVSTISVYADFSRPGLTEDAPVRAHDTEDVAAWTPETYGPLKTLCERTLEAAMPGRALHVRPGLIVGPHDPTDRFTYWPHRLAAGGDVLAPGRPDRPFQAIDARDLAAWIVRMVEDRATGVYNATGQEPPRTLEDFLAEVAQALNVEVRLRWAPDAYLTERGVTGSDLPFWVPETHRGLLSVDSSRAVGAGLRFRALAETIRDTREWAVARPADHAWRAGLSPAREQALLADLQGRGIRPGS